MTSYSYRDIHDFAGVVKPTHISNLQRESKRERKRVIVRVISVNRRGEREKEREGEREENAILRNSHTFRENDFTASR